MIMQFSDDCLGSITSIETYFEDPFLFEATNLRQLMSQFSIIYHRIGVGVNTGEVCLFILTETRYHHPQNQIHLTPKSESIYGHLESYCVEDLD